MFTGNPHQDQRGLDRRGHKSFTSGWKSGWKDRKLAPAIPTPEATWQKPAPWQGDAPWKKGPLGDQANYSTKDRVYDDWIIKDYLQQGIISPREVKDIGKPGYKQVVPQLMGQQLASNDYGYGTDNFYNPNDDEYYDDYSDMYKDNPMRDDFYVQDPFSDIWGNQGGPLSFS
jgi:hypothetical protein